MDQPRCPAVYPWDKDRSDESESRCRHELGHEGSHWAALVEWTDEAVATAIHDLNARGLALAALCREIIAAERCEHPDEWRAKVDELVSGPWRGSPGAPFLPSYDVTLLVPHGSGVSGAMTVRQALDRARAELEAEGWASIFIKGAEQVRVPQVDSAPWPGFAVTATVSDSTDGF